MAVDGGRLCAVGIVPLWFLKCFVIYQYFYVKYLVKVSYAKGVIANFCQVGIFQSQIWQDSSNGMNYNSANMKPMHIPSRVELLNTLNENISKGFRVTLFITSLNYCAEVRLIRLFLTN
jgi:hypothetical protein